MRVVEQEIGEDDLHALLAVAAELVVAVHAARVRRRIIRRRERPVFGHVAAEHLVASRTCVKRTPVKSTCTQRTLITKQPHKTDKFSKI